jgi:hypothetical protein
MGVWQWFPLFCPQFLRYSTVSTCFMHSYFLIVFATSEKMSQPARVHELGPSHDLFTDVKAVKKDGGAAILGALWGSKLETPNHSPQ